MDTDTSKAHHLCNTSNSPCNTRSLHLNLITITSNIINKRRLRITDIELIAVAAVSRLAWPRFAVVSFAKRAVNVVQTAASAPKIVVRS